MTDEPDNNLSQLPDDWPCYVPEVGEVTVGAIRDTLADTDDATVRMWGYIATHPHEKPWLRWGPRG